MIKAALFDLDGVVFNTEPQYSVFWKSQCELYHPEVKDMYKQIKGKTLVQIYDEYFADVKEEQPKITQRLDEFERKMTFEYIPGLVDFVNDLKRHGVRCAVVTSSNRNKMKNVYDHHPDFLTLFNRVLTSESFAKSKPDPDCYLKGAAIFGADPKDCVGFEDSFNGLKAVRAAGEFTMGLATTNTKTAIKKYSDYVITDYVGLDYAKLCEIVIPSH